MDESIRIEAYLLSEKAGHPSGREHDFWREAQAVVHARAGTVATVVRKAAAKPAAKRKEAAAVKKANAKGKAARKPVLNGANGKDHQLSLGEEMASPARKRAGKKSVGW